MGESIESYERKQDRLEAEVDWYDEHDDPMERAERQAEEVDPAADLEAHGEGYA